jgi:hypothetical protein
MYSILYSPKIDEFEMTHNKPKLTMNFSVTTQNQNLTQCKPLLRLLLLIFSLPLTDKIS